MSWRAWTEDGYGYPLFNETNFKTVMKFIADEKNDPEVLKCEDEFDFKDLWSACPAEIVAEIINEKEGYNVFYGYDSCGDTNQEEYIGVNTSYPWVFMRDNALLTKEKANEILEKYAEVLGINESPEYFEAYYCG